MLIIHVHLGLLTEGHFEQETSQNNLFYNLRVVLWSFFSSVLEHLVVDIH